MPSYERGSLVDLALAGELSAEITGEVLAHADRPGHAAAQAVGATALAVPKNLGLTLYDSGVDFSYTISQSTASCLRANRGGFVCVYIKWTGRASVLAYRAAGLRVVPIYETSGTDYRNGYPAGVTAAQAFLTWCAANGFAGAEVYYAYDEDVLGLGRGAQANAYAQGWRDTITLARANAYAESQLISQLLNAGLIHRGWVTYAWSGGALDPRSTLYQNPNNQNMCGVSVDFDRAFQATIGAIGETAPPPPPASHAVDLLLLGGSA